MKLMRMLSIAVAATVAVLAGGILLVRLSAAPDPALLYGNVEIRQVDLAFNDEGTITAMRKLEGDEVRKGEIIAALDPASYQAAKSLTEARRDAAQAALDKLLNGSRPEDIDQARANVANARASLADAQVTLGRQQKLFQSSVVTHQAYDDAQRGFDTARAQVAQTEAALLEAVHGARIEDIDAARAGLKEAEASLDLATTELDRTVLKAPCDGILMTRIVEPGTVVLPSSPVYSVAIEGEVWVRGFIPETLLARGVPGLEVVVLTDGRPGKPYHGTIGYVSPTAEFTPKTVETPELRTQLVYRIRIRITDPDAGIRQGQPVTIRLPPERFS